MGKVVDRLKLHAIGGIKEVPTKSRAKPTFWRERKLEPEFAES